MTISVSQLMLEAGQKARAASRRMAAASTAEKNKALLCLADLLEAKGQEIFEANKQDLAKALENGLKESFVDRLCVTEKVLQLMAEGARQTAALPDPVGEISEMRRRPSGIQVGRMRVPLGVLGIIYESRPNVTVDAACLAIKSGNACILRGGSEAFETNRILGELVQEALTIAGLPTQAVQIAPTTDRAFVGELIRANKYIDVIIPRGGKGLINYHTKQYGDVAAITMVGEDEDVILIASDGILIRIPASDISEFARPSKGVRVMRVSEGEKVVTVSVTEKSEEEETDDAAEASEAPQEAAADAPAEETTAGEDA